jgi:hypothetical protein
MCIQLTASEILTLRMALSSSTGEWLDKYQQETDEKQKATILRIMDNQHDLYEKLVQWHDERLLIENHAENNV